MKHTTLRVLVAFLLILAMALPLFACNGAPTDDNPAETTLPTETIEAPTETIETSTDVPMPTEVALPEGYETADVTYDCQDDSTLYTFTNKAEADFTAVINHYKGLGFRVYSDVNKNGSRFATLVGDGPMAHIYWLKNNGELNIVLSATAAASLLHCIFPY